ncbi:MAG: hypothetical protein KDK75_12385 [Alphaproteobacteria bacterium]|nr:hypothetical protein [Alphaproteobacteria bacterium]
MPFKRNLKHYRDQLEQDGYILLKDIISDDFMATLQEFLAKSRTGDVSEYGTWRIGGKKHQFLYDFPSEDIADRFRSELAALTGLNEQGFTISERHLKQYEDDAPEYPAPHKDRGASKYSIGLPIHLGPETSVCVFPTLDREPNEGERAVFMTEKDNPGLADIYASPDALALNEELGDMIVFLGSSIYHERIRPRGTAVLYIKVNDEGFDPLGENIYAQDKEAVSA